MALRALDYPADIEDWARDMVATQAARVYLMIGDEPRALETMKGRAPAEVAKFEVARVSSADAAQLDSQADAFDRGIATMNFDLARSGIDGYSALLVRVLDDAPRRDRALKALEAAITGLPIDLQVTVNADVAVSLHEHGQPALAAGFLKRAVELNANTAFLAQDLAPYGVVVAKARLRMGDVAGARADLVRLRAQYDANSQQIVNLRRAQSLRALAEGFALIGDRDEAVRCQREALEAGTINPNSRPRAEDLSATCASIALTGIEPDASIRKQIERARAGLADPW
jgi:tetratricopeptide (TPR) repeat protein